MRIILCLIFYSLGLSAYSQTEADVHKALSTGNAEALASHFNNGIELSINQKKGIYSKQQAELILIDFFEKNQPKAYTVKHEGGDLKRSKFSIGIFSSKSNTFRSHLLYKEVDNAIQIIELRIELQE